MVTGPPEKPNYGALELQVRFDVGLLGELTDARGSLAEMAYVLARIIDRGAGVTTAAVARELRMTLAEVMRGPVTDDDSLTSLIAGLGLPDRADVPTPVRDTKDTQPGDEGPKGS